MCTIYVVFCTVQSVNEFSAVSLLIALQMTYRDVAVFVTAVCSTVHRYTTAFCHMWNSHCFAFICGMIIEFR